MHIVTSVRVKSDFAEGSSLTRVLQPVKRLAGVLLVNFAIQTAVAFDVEGSHFLRIATLGGVPSLLVFTSSQEGGSDDFYLQYAPHGSLSKESTALPSTLIFFHCFQMLEAITLLYIVFQECNKAGLRAVFQQPENEGSAEWWQWRSGLVYSATAEVNAYQVSEL